jgi:hypothetical protein
MTRTTLVEKVVLQEGMSCFIASGIGAAAAILPGNEQHYSVALHFMTSLYQCTPSKRLLLS